MSYLEERLKEWSTWKGIIQVSAAIIMYFTPDNIDQIITMALGFVGIGEVITIERK